MFAIHTQIVTIQGICVQWGEGTVLNMALTLMPYKCYCLIAWQGLSITYLESVLPHYTHLCMIAPCVQVQVEISTEELD